MTEVQKSEAAPQVPRYLINTPFPGAFVEGVGVLRPGTEIDLPEELMIGNSHHPKADAKTGLRTVVIEPRETWWPLNDAAWDLFEKHKRIPKTPAQINVQYKPPAPDEDPEAERKKAEQDAKFKSQFAALRKMHTAPAEPEQKPEGKPSAPPAGKPRGGRASDSE